MYDQLFARTEEKTAFLYIAYGLCIQSTLVLPELMPIDDDSLIDIHIRFDSISWRPPAGDHSDGYVCGDEREAFIYVDEVGAFAIRNGCEILIDSEPGATEDYVRVFLLGGALGLLLHQRGMLVLHSSAVAINGGAIAFLGNSGEGKSTTAAAMHARGHAMLADDMIAIQTNGSIPYISPGFPRLKVWPEVAATLQLRDEELHEFNSDDERRDWRSRNDFSAQSLPLRCIYLLEEDEEGAEPAMECLDAQDAFATLVQFSYAVGLLGEGAATPSHFKQCVQLAASIPIYLLSRQRSLADLPHIAAFIDEHLRETSDDE